MIGGIVPDDMDEAFVEVARLDLGEKLRGAVERQKRPSSLSLSSASLRRCHSGLLPFPAIDGQRIPASLALALVPAPNAVAIKVENLGNGLA